jgi:hypothetical protein
VTAKKNRKKKEMIVHNANGPYLMDKSKWPVLKLASENVEANPIESLTQEDSLVASKTGDGMPESPMFNVSSRKGYAEEDLMDNSSVQSKDSDLEDANQGWKAPKSRNSKKLKRKHVVTPSVLPRVNASKRSMRIFFWCFV